MPSPFFTSEIQSFSFDAILMHLVRYAIAADPRNADNILIGKFDS